MPISIKHITFDALDPQGLAQFWSAVTGQPIENDWDGFVVLAESNNLPRLAFYKTDDKKTIKDRVHLDLKVPELADETKRLTQLGAKVESSHKNDHLAWNIMTDPEGNEFCISADW